MGGVEEEGVLEVAFEEGEGEGVAGGQELGEHVFGDADGLVADADVAVFEEAFGECEFGGVFEGEGGEEGQQVAVAHPLLVSPQHQVHEAQFLDAVDF